MRRRVAALSAAALAVGVAFFFLVPFVFWLDYPVGCCGRVTRVPVYLSLACATVGVGAEYMPGGLGYDLVCKDLPPVLLGG
jgi:hypothetical protein